MSVKKLNGKVQSLFCSSINVSNYKKAIEELVYNSLDAQASSIAIRVSIQENQIQVIDNGGGVHEKDFALLGTRYATSKFVDLLHYKSVPNTYGYRGQSLASIIDVSKTVTVTSRTEPTENTWVKTFSKGKEKDVLRTLRRPSKGTTVQISGFLYNLKIQNKAIHAVQELYDIKTFLKQLSLIHSNISLSLRNDDRNEIIFKIHKNRDIRQTLKSLFDIEQKNIQELQVEKNHYKLLAFIGKKNDVLGEYHWIFLNKRYVSNNKIQTIVTDNFVKSFHGKIKQRNVKNLKSKETAEKSNVGIPFYFIFISCPYYDYGITDTSKQAIIEFKDWKPIEMLIKKMIQFYNGDLKVKQITMKDKDHEESDQDPDMREKIKDIMDKILRSNSKKLGTSQMQNGIKGKLIKRNTKKANNRKFKLLIDKESIDQKSKHDVIENITKLKICPVTKLNNAVICEPDSTLFVAFEKFKNNKFKRSVHNDRYIDREKATAKKQLYTNEPVKTKTLDTIIKKFRKQPDTVKNRCDMIAKEVDNLLNYYKQSRIEIRHKNNKYKYVRNNKKSLSLRIRDGLANHKILPTKAKYHTLTTYDLLQPVWTTQNKNSLFSYNYKNGTENYAKRSYWNDIKSLDLTYQSHCYNAYSKRCNTFHRNSDIRRISTPINQTFKDSKKKTKVNFISRQSKENFRDLKLQKGNKAVLSKKENKKIVESYSYTIENTQTIKYKDSLPLIENDSNKNIDTINSTNIELTYTVTSSKITLGDGNIISSMNTYAKKTQYENYSKSINMDNIKPNINKTLYLHKSQYENSEIYNDNNVPIRFCEAVLSDCESGMSLDDYNILSKHLSQDNATSRNVSCVLNTETHEGVYEINKQNDNFVMIGNNSTHSVLSTIQSKQENGNLVLPCSSNIIPNSEPNNLSVDVVNNSCNFNNSFNVKKSHIKNSIQISETVEIEKSGNVLLRNNCLTLKNNVENVNSKDDVNIQGIEGNSKYQDDHKLNENVECSPKQSDFFINTNTEKSNNMFSINNRHRFLPKGISPIFKNNNTKTVISDDFLIGYFESKLYDNFVTDIQANTGIYEANVRNTKDITTKDVEKVNSRLKKDNASLTFIAQSLKEGRVLGQVDNKYIATILKGDSDTKSYLVLFDQHAVHERIRLERLMTEYFEDKKWKSVALEINFTLKMSRDEIVFLHNCKEKLNQLGLQWTLRGSNEIEVHAIPTAILGQNPREVERVIKTVKNLISEEICDIKTQKGCVTLYPKSIMDLVFSEACRYAIKFGDTLSRIDCSELIQSLSACKTPFRCAHGRPVMAVIMNIGSIPHSYKVNMYKLKKLRANQQVI